MTLKGYTQARLADEVGVSLRAAHKWCVGDAVPDYEKRLLIARLLDKPPEWFWDFDENELEPAA